MLSDSHRRALVALLALVCAAVAVWLYWIDPALGEKYPQFAGGAVRMIPLLIVVWLALPEVRRGPGAILFLIAVVCAAALLFKAGRSGLKFILPAVGALIALGYLRRFTGLLGGNPRK